VDANRDRELADLLLQAQEGNQAAYERFLLEASATLRAYLSRRMQRPESVEDVLQETLLSIHRARHTYLPDRPVGPWLFAICRNRMTDFYRRHRRIERVEVYAPDEGASCAMRSADSPSSSSGSSSCSRFTTSRSRKQPHAPA
jgi:RNA polymerase sigma-70 factor, ECF subfamily